ncbi:hypothetical protein [Kitasatospora sp. NPDC090308]|uniref:hypothetical protein n=1 Tax=Kitasatospora sp. NPDC090308 TaxID=3364082 RepID=UPI0038081AB0
MTDLAVVARLLDEDDLPVQRLTCHPRLPPAAGTGADGRSIRVWDCSGGRLRTLASFQVAAVTTPRGGPVPPPVAWHPHEPLLVVGDGGALRRWTPDGPAAPLPARTGYRHLAFSPDGRSLWAAPSGGGAETSDVLDPSTGAPATRSAHWWDTGVGVHPSGGLVATLVSEQGGTLCLFARSGDGPGGGPAAMRPVRRALVLDADGYGAPLFSADGRHVALRGNAYVDSLDVFAFPSLRRALHAVLGTDEQWHRHALAFGPRPGALWIGTPGGTLIELDAEARTAVEHPGPGGAAVTAPAATAAGELLAARADGGLALLSAGPAPTGAAPDGSLAAFLAGTEEIPADGAPEPHLVLTDGRGTWDADSLETVTDASPADPGWLRIQAHVNRAKARES